MRPRDSRRLRRVARTRTSAAQPSRSRSIADAERAAKIEQLHEEHDLLCLPPPSSWRIALHLGEAQ